MKGQKVVSLSKTKNKLFGYGSKTSLDVQGCFKAQVESKHKILLATFYVINDISGCLLSVPTAIDLGPVKIDSVSQDTNRVLISLLLIHLLKNLLVKHDHVFTGIGKLRNYKLHLHIDKSVPPYNLREFHLP